MKNLLTLYPKNSKDGTSLQELIISKGNSEFRCEVTNNLDTVSYDFHIIYKPKSLVKNSKGVSSYNSKYLLSITQNNKKGKKKINMPMSDNKEHLFNSIVHFLHNEKLLPLKGERKSVSSEDQEVVDNIMSVTDEFEFDVKKELSSSDIKNIELYEVYKDKKSGLVRFNLYCHTTSGERKSISDSSFVLCSQKSKEKLSDPSYIYLQDELGLSDRFFYTLNSDVYIESKLNKLEDSQVFTNEELNSLIEEDLYFYFCQKITLESILNTIKDMIYPFTSFIGKEVIYNNKSIGVLEQDEE